MEITVPLAVLVTIFLGFITLACGALGWWLRDLWEAHKALRQELSDFKEHVPREYVAKGDFREDMKEIKATLGRMFDRLDKMASLQHHRSTQED